MRVCDHKLFTADEIPARFVPTPNLGHGRLQPRYLVVHYTAGRDLESAVKWLTNPVAGASAHLVIGRHGEVVQLAPFDRITLHAGRSRWRGLEGLNAHAIGIELDNPGRLDHKGGRWHTWFGCPIADDLVMRAEHRNQPGICGWHVYSEMQIETAVLVARALIDTYGLREVVGHDDIAPHRKQDPGPAFPMDSFRGRAMGRADDRLELYETATALNIRSGPGLDFARLPPSPLPPGTRLRVVQPHNGWCAVEVLDGDLAPQLTGWVHGDYIRPVAG
jgi:N-acetylmuramoyl-L-alanine amidase